MVERITIDFVIKLELKNNIISSIFIEFILVLADNLETTVLLDDFTDVIDETIEGIHLLTD